MKNPNILIELVKSLPEILRAAGATELALAAFFFLLGVALIIYLMQSSKPFWKFASIVLWFIAAGTVFVLVTGSPTALETKSTNLALGKPTRTSVGRSAPQVVDGDPTNAWNAGRLPPVWVEIDLGDSHTVREIVLVHEQAPAGPSTHKIIGYRDDGSESVLAIFSNTTDAGTRQSQKIPIVAGTGILRVRVNTDSVNSWVAWREIEVRGNF